MNEKTLKVVQEIVDKAEVPADVGKLPGKIDKFSFDGFTADELKNFFILFSVYSLHGILPKRDLECLRKFVIACSYLCNRVITKTDLQIADNYLMKFCSEFENIYGKDRVTPNMHLHGHLVDCMNDFGPVYSFWLFSFERYNGLLGSIPSNKKSIEMQIMNRFCRDNETIGSNYPEECYTDFYPFVAKLGKVNIDRGALHDILGSDYVSILKLSSRHFNHKSYEWLTPHYAKMTGQY